MRQCNSTSEAQRWKYLLGLRDGSAPKRVNSRQSLSTGARFVDVDDLINSAEVTDLRLCPK